MSWLSEHKHDLRIALLVLLVVALCGPWTYTRDGVGALPPEQCRPPLILLENGRCVRLVSGMSMLTFGIGALISLCAQLLTGAMEIGRMREFLVVLYVLLPTLPIVSALFVFWRSESHRLRVAHAVTWGLAAGWSLLLLLTTSRPALGHVWGAWVYVGVAASSLTLELSTPVQRRTED
jgi:hypothetical protein